MSNRKQKYIVFTDLDGTLLDHESYCWHEAENALQLLKELEVPIIFNTSKTMREVRELQEQLSVRHPFITENGMVTSIPAGYFPGVDKDTHLFHGKPYKTVRRILTSLRNNHGFEFVGFGDCSPAQIAEFSGLLPFEASYASDRKASEPIIWQDSDKGLNFFEQLLRDEGLYLTRGGRFYHVSGKGNKGLAVQRLLERFETHFPDYEWISIGLGDGLNDLPMLEVVNYPVLIRSDHGSAPDISHLSYILETTHTGSRGWNEAITRLLMD